MCLEGGWYIELFYPWVVWSSVKCTDKTSVYIVMNGVSDSNTYVFKAVSYNEIL